MTRNNPGTLEHMLGYATPLHHLPSLARMALLLSVLGLSACSAIQQKEAVVSPTKVKLALPLDTRSTTGEWFIADQSDIRQAEIDDVLWVRVGREIRQEEAYLELLGQGNPTGQRGQGTITDIGDSDANQGQGLVIRFDTAKTEPLADLEIPRGALQVLREAKRVIIEGHTDSVGSKASNNQLANRRAQIVAKWLIAHGVLAQQIETIAVGAGVPIADNKTAEGRRLNRRAVVRVESDHSS